MAEQKVVKTRAKSVKKTVKTANAKKVATEQIPDSGLSLVTELQITPEMSPEPENPGLPEFQENWLKMDSISEMCGFMNRKPTTASIYELVLSNELIFAFDSILEGLRAMAQLHVYLNSDENKRDSESKWVNTSDVGVFKAIGEETRLCAARFRDTGRIELQSQFWDISSGELFQWNKPEIAGIRQFRKENRPIIREMRAIRG